MKLFSGFLLTIGLLFFFTTAYSQNEPTTEKSQIETIDGNEYIGVILEMTPEIVRIKTDKLGEITIPAKEIKSISQIKNVQTKDGSYWLDNPQSTRYFWAPNGHNLAQGEGYYQNVWIMFNQAIFGISDHFSGGVGVMPLFLFAGASTPAWLMLRYSTPIVKDKLSIGAGALAGTVIGEQNTGFGILYGVSTFGSKDKNLNVGLGWAFAGGEIAKRPTVNISAMIRTGARGYFITENYFIGTPNEFVVLMMLGGRRIIKHTGLDFGVVLPLGSAIESFVAIPWLGFTIPFGSKTQLINK